ncbi:MAG: OadG family transporter subunit [Lewinella sp.]|jgi:oxaloacetate decarboxylase gamma subunit|uniref:OadG family transporter subunit n=1 Tax=Lewinella sp. TaxID=2004506 RepID=UPI003D6A7460
MTQAIRDALELLLVGMTTVALVLGLVVLAGRLLIQLVNRTSPRGPGKKAPPSSSSSSLDPAIVAVITAAVDVSTAGQGSIQKIDSL